jgi:uncharacterized protein
METVRELAGKISEVVNPERMDSSVDGELSLLIKPVSADCNMRCEYCFYRRPTDPYRSHERHIMDDMTLQTMIARYMKAAGRCASFGWQGGEPLLAGIDFFKKVVHYQQLHGLPAQMVGNNLQTNGLLINEEWAKFFRQYNFFIGVSLDGPEEYHHCYRHSANGDDGFQQTMKGIRTLRDHHVGFSILSVVNDVTAKKPGDLYDFFIRNGLDRLQFIPCLEINRETGKAERHSVTVEDYRDFLCTLFDVWYNNGRPIASIRLFENILAIYMGKDPEICAFMDRCGSYVVIEFNGDVYPCDFFVEEQWVLGNLRETSITDIMKKRKRREFNSRKRQRSPGCNPCEWNFICHYGCQHYRSPAGENYFCHAYGEFFRYTRRRFETLAGNLLEAEPEGSRNPKRTPVQSHHDAEKGRQSG